MADFLLSARQDCSGQFVLSLVGVDGDRIARSGITSCVLTVATLSGDIVNSRASQDVRGTGTGANGVTIAEDGTITWDMEPEDNAVLSPTAQLARTDRATERHRVTWVVGLSGGGQAVVAGYVDVLHLRTPLAD